MQSSGHTVLASADSEVYASFASARARARIRDVGRALRREVPRRRALPGGGHRPIVPTRPIDHGIAPGAPGLADTGPGCPDGISPYGFLRGTAILMAERAARLPATGINPVVCGDSHLGNFGFYASPEVNSSST